MLNQNDELLSFVLPSIGLGPFSLIVPEKGIEHLVSGRGIHISDAGRTVEIGDWKLEIGQEPEIWDPVPQWSHLKNVQFSMSLDNFASLPELVQTRFDQLLVQIAAKDHIEVVKATQKLAGLGEGLTPIGDDLLIGVLFALWVNQPDSELIPLIGNTAVPLTTTLSGAFLKSAVAGEATIHWHNLANHHPDAKQKILSIGHTSGAAAWTGFAQTLPILRRE
ncbi:MAG: DUF2877 domain-containing protein [Chloroflexota bacterium]